MTAWTAELRRDGELVCDPVPVDDWEAANILAPLVVGWLGGRVSIGAAIVATRPVPADEQPSLFEAVA